MAIAGQGIALGKHKRLGAGAVGQETRKIYASVKSVVAAGGKQKPTVAATPIVEALSVTTVNLSHVPYLASGQVEQTKVGLGMPY